VQKGTWPLERAKNAFSAVVKAAQRGEPQTVTKHGRPAAVVISAAEYERLRQAERAVAPRLNDLLLAMPTDDGTFDRLQLRPRRFEG
jgi:antitoxin Phd